MMFKSMFRVLSLVFFIVLSFSTLAEEIDWNDDKLKWHEYTDGIELIKKEKKLGF